MNGHPERNPDDPDLHVVDDRVDDDVVRLPVEEGVARLRPERPIMTGTPPPLKPAADKDGEGVADILPEEARDPEEVWEETHRRPRSIPIGFVVLLALLFVAAGIWAALRITDGERRLETEAERVERLLAEEEERTRSAAALLEVVERKLDQYLGATTVVAKAAHVRHPDRVRPLMETYYRDHPLEPQRAERIGRFLPLAMDNRPFILVTVLLDDGQELTLLAEQVAEHEVRFDWESEVAYQPMPLAQYLAERPLEPVDFRVFVADDEFYAFEFSDREKWRSLFLTVRDETEYLFAYVERGSEADERIDEFLGDSGRAVPMLLRVRFLPDAESTRSVLVEEVLAPRWAYLEGQAS